MGSQPPLTEGAKPMIRISTSRTSLDKDDSLGSTPLTPGSAFSSSSSDDSDTEQHSPTEPEYREEAFISTDKDSLAPQLQRSNSTSSNGSAESLVQFIKTSQDEEPATVHPYSPSSSLDKPDAIANENPVTRSIYEEEYRKRMIERLRHDTGDVPKSVAGASKNRIISPKSLIPNPSSLLGKPSKVFDENDPLNEEDNEPIDQDLFADFDGEFTTDAIEKAKVLEALSKPNQELQPTERKYHTTLHDARLMMRGGTWLKVLEGFEGPEQEWASLFNEKVSSLTETDLHSFRTRNSHDWQSLFSSLEKRCKAILDISETSSKDTVKRYVEIEAQQIASRVKNLVGSIANAQSVLRHSTRQSKAFENAIQPYEDAAAKSQEQCAQLARDNAQLRNSIEADEEKHDAQIAHLKADIERTKDELSRTIKELEETKKMNESHIKLVAEGFQHKIGYVEKKADLERRKSMQELRKHDKRSRSRFRGMSNDWERKVQQSKTDGENKLASLQDKASSVASEKEQLAAELASEKAAHEQLKREVCKNWQIYEAKHAKEAEDWAHQQQRDRKTIAALREQFDEWDDERMKALRNLTDTKIAADNFQNEVRVNWKYYDDRAIMQKETLEAEIQKLTLQVTNMQTRDSNYAKLEESREKLKEELDNERDAHQQLKLDVHRNWEAYERSQNEKTWNLEAKVQELTDQLQELQPVKVKYDSLSSVIVSWKARVLEWKTECESQLAIAKERGDKYKSELGALKERVRREENIQAAIDACPNPDASWNAYLPFTGLPSPHIKYKSKMYTKQREAELLARQEETRRSYREEMKRIKEDSENYKEYWAARTQTWRTDYRNKTDGKVSKTYRNVATKLKSLGGNSDEDPEIILRNLTDRMC